MFQVGYTIVKSVRHSRKKPANVPELEAEGVETTVEAVEGGEITEEQPGPSNVVSGMLKSHLCTLQLQFLFLI